VSGNPGTGTRKRTHWLPDGKTDRSAVANVGYARVSTLDQDLSLQLDALAAVGCGKVFEDRASGARADRAGLQAALDYVRDGEVLVVWKLDRLGRSLPHLIETVTALSNRGVGLRLLTEALDTTTPGGRLIFRGAGPVRARPDPRTHARRPRRCHGAGAQERPQARHHGRQAEPRARHGRHGPDRARDRNTAESREDSALRGAQGRTRLTACPPLAVRSSEVAARDTTVGSGPGCSGPFRSGDPSRSRWLGAAASWARDRLGRTASPPGPLWTEMADTAPQSARLGVPHEPPR